MILLGFHKGPAEIEDTLKLQESVSIEKGFVVFGHGRIGKYWRRKVNQGVRHQFYRPIAED
jgi:hypothetical protein